MAKIDLAYNGLVHKIMGDGFVKQDPTRQADGSTMGKREIPSYHFEYSMRDGFPLLTSKKIPWKLVASELCFFIRGDENISILHEDGCHIWDKDAYAFFKRNWGGNPLSFDEFIAKAGKIHSESVFKTVRVSNFTKEGYTDKKIGEKIKFPIGYLGPVYGSQWRRYDGHGEDQLADMIANMIHNPYSNRHMVTAWNPNRLSSMALPPCHYGFMCSVYDVDGGKGFYLTWNQRSVDVFLGLPFNIASYAMLGEVISAITGYRFLGLYGNLNNVHIYDPHWPAMEVQLRNGDEKPSPKLKISESFVRRAEECKDADSIATLLNSIKTSDFDVVGYDSYGRIKAEMFEPMA